jgi:hypothetical protein
MRRSGMNVLVMTVLREVIIVRRSVFLVVGLMITAPSSIRMAVS